MAAQTGKAMLAGVIGRPVGHSLSPALHEYWLKKYGIDGAYIPLDVPEGAFNDVLKTLSLLGFRGANVTIPYKEQAFAAVSGMDEMARISGAVNTLVRQENGNFYGKNTDIPGFLENLRTGDVAPEKLRHAAILGAGGAARGIAAGLAMAGCPEITLLNRTREKAEILAQTLMEKGVSAIFHIKDWEARTEILGGIDLLVNTTQLGMLGQMPLEIDLATLPAAAAVCDIVYNPLVTPLLKDAAARGHKTVEGLGMLLHQAVPGFEAWFGVKPEVTGELHDIIAAMIAPC